MVDEQERTEMSLFREYPRARGGEAPHCSPPQRLGGRGSWAPLLPWSPHALQAYLS